MTKTLQSKTIAFIGAGNMAASILHGLIKSGVSERNIYVSNPSQGKLEALKNDYPALNTSNSNQEVAKAAEVVIFAVKPQKLSDACKDLLSLDFSKKLVVSVAAGVTTTIFQNLLGDNTPVIRSMPNTPSMIGFGATGLFANAHVNDSQKPLAEAIFDAVGSSVWIDDESQMDLVTAVSGSGPAHYFLYMESVVNSAIKQGMDENTARLLAAQTALGAAAMVQANPQLEISQLRRNVTSPGGTTAAALDVLEQQHLPQIVDQSLRASVNRGKVLATIAENDMIVQDSNTQ